jgi:H+-transporting ATPase
MTSATDQPKTPDPKPSGSTDPKPDASVAKSEVKDATKADAKPKAVASKPDAKATAKPDAKPDAKTGAKPDAKPAPQDDLKTLPMAEVEKKLGSSPDGLTDAEAKKRLTQYGPNELVEKKTNLLLKFLGYFWGPIPWMIEVAVILSGVVRHWPDFFIILLLLVTNAVVAFWEERQAGNEIATLKAKLAIKARVIRDGKWINPPARELVPGDVIRLRLGDVVPADARLLAGDEVSVDQSALTGESLPTTRKAGEAVFSGSIVRRGEIGALVYATGEKTYFGKTAQLVQEALTVSHFQKAVLKIGNYLIILAVALVAVIIGFAIYRGDKILETLQFALVLTVAAIPVAMPTVLSVTMAVGARLLAKKKAIVSRLVAIEELAGVDVLCADKTGTLTQNKLTLGDPFSVNKVTAEQIILSAALASRAENNDTIDLAVLGGLKNKDALKEYQVVHFLPFDPVHKRTEATVKGKDGNTFKVTKGAPQVILAMSANAGEIQAAADKAVNDFAARGFRSLGVARAEGDGPWQFLGVLPMFDPPREDAKATIATALTMGVKIKMVTGDQIAIAKEMAKTLGMGTNILDAKTLGDSKKQESAAVIESIEKADGFAGVFPEHKFHIVDVLQKHNHIVGMTGDGVNDAPALKKADCGIAVSSATDAARAAAAIVLLTPGLSVIIDAIKESRRIFQRMNSYAIYRIAETLRVLFFMTLAILVFNFYPLTAVMIVMLALLNDGAILSIAYDNVHYKNKPEAWNMRMVLGISTVLGVIGVVAAFGLFFLGERVFHLDRPHIQTLMYLKLSVAGHLTVFLTRTRGPFWSIRPAKILWMAVLGTQTVATLIAVYGLFMTPLGWGWAGFVWGYALLWFLVNDRIKLLAYRIFDPVKKAGANPEIKVASQPDAKSDEKTTAKPEAKAEPQSAAKDEQKPEVKTDAKAEANPDGKAEPKPEAKVEPQPDANADAKPGAKDEPEPEAKTEPKPDPKAMPKPDAIAESKPETKTVGPDPEAKAKPKPDAQAEPKPEAKAEAQPESKPDAKVEDTPDTKGEPKPEAKVEPKPEAKTKTTADLTPQIAARAYELYERQGHRDGQSAQNWDKAEQEIRATQTKAEPKAESKPAAKAGSAPEATTQPIPDGNPKPAAKVELASAAKVEPKPEIKPDVKPEATSEPKPEIKTEPAAAAKAPAKPEGTAVPPSAAKSETNPDHKAAAKPTDNVEPKPEVKAETKPATNGKPAAEVSPQLVQRVHKFYEQLGREDVRAVEESDQAKQKAPEVETTK